MVRGASKLCRPTSRSRRQLPDRMLRCTVFGDDVFGDDEPLEVRLTVTCQR